MLRERSVDNFRKLETIFGVWTLPPPAAVAMAGSTEDVAAVLAFANEHGINVVPRTGGTATEGGLETHVPDSIVLDGGRMNRILTIDPYGMQATAQCGVPLQALEDEARKHGLTTGHSPQSKPVAHMGGLVATRSIGQFSTLYGGIEDMVVGLEAVFPGGEVARIKNVPRRAAGPDIRHVVIGNEGALCFITEVTVKLFPFLPENNAYARLDAEEHEDGLRGAARGDGDRLQAVGRAPLRPRGRRHPLLPLRGCGRLRPPLHGRGPGRDRARHRRGNRGDRRPTSRADPRRRRAHPRRGSRTSRGGRTRSQREDERIRTTRNVNRTTEISAGWSAINDIYEAALARIRAEIPDLTILGGHSSHSYVNGTNMYFNYFYDLVDCAPRGGGDEVLPPDHLDHLRGDAALRRLDRAPPRDRQGAGALGAARSTARPTGSSRR